MSFPFLTSFAFFWWLLALALPVVIHLLNRRRHRVMQWAAMEFLLRATRESRGKKKLKHILILTSRALAIVALVLAVARPLSSSGFLAWGGGKIDTVILVLDRSASMEQSSQESSISKREKALSMVKKSLAELPNTKLILIDSASGTPIPISKLNTLDSISQTRATDTQANIPALLDTAIQYILKNSTGRTEIWLATDLQQSDWLPDSGKWSNVRSGLQTISEHSSLRVLALNAPANNNLSIQILGAQRVDNALSLELEITQSGQNQSLDSLPITLSLDGVQTTENVTLAGASLRFTKRVELTSGSGFGYLQLPADTNARDNTAYFAYGEETPVHSAIVAPKSEAQFYLQLAAAPPGYAKQQAASYLPHEPIPWEQLSLVIWQAPLPEDSTPLLDFINKGGIIVFFPPSETHETTFLNTRWGDLSSASSGKFFIVQDWDRNDGPLRNGDDGKSIPVQKLKAIQRREILSNTNSLARWSDGQTFLSRELHGKGAAYFVSSLPDYTWSNLGDADVLLPLIQRALLTGNLRFGSGFSATLGDLPAEIALDASERKRLDKATPNHPLNADFEAGVYQIGSRNIALNRPAEEDSAPTLERDTIDKDLANTRYTLFEDNSRADSSFSQPLWHACFIAMLLFLILEALLCLNPKRKPSSH